MIEARGRVVLVGGGARSGKSTLALRLALAVPGRRVFVATATVGDDEMRDRIDRHRVERGALFETVEEPLALPELLAELRADVVLVDCLTLWLSNLMMAEHPDVEGEVLRLVQALDQPGRTVIVVSNEVGLGIVPDNALARRFRDVAGRAHQRLAARADEVYAGMLGLMLRLKPGPVEAVVDPGAA